VLSRRRLLGLTAALAALPAVGACTAPVEDQGGPPTPAVPEPAAPPRVLPPLTVVRGADLSFTLQLERAGLGFSDAGRSASVEQLLAARGMNLVRLRLWVDPPPDTSDLAATLALARRANAAGCHTMLALHYADFWADPTHQPTPRAWAGRDLDELADNVRRYTTDVVSALAAQGTPPALVQIGNEVSNGMLWPSGRIQRGTTAEWDVLATLLQAGVLGVRDAGPDVRTVVHTDRGGDRRGCERFFGNLLDRGVEFDVAGLSYFPWWHGPLAALSANLDGIVERIDRPVAVVESAYPWTLQTDGIPDPYVPHARALPEADRFPPTPQGQAAFFAALRTVIDDVSGDAGLGFVAWEPAWLAAVRPSPGEPNRFANLTMFDRAGAGLPALEVFAA
jgi:arabinogalactan endo-1,4-beta-galactosidase